MTISSEKKPPRWILESGRQDIERLTAAWRSAQDKLRVQRVTKYVKKPLRSGFDLPKAVLWRPPVITTVPGTRVVMDALHTGVLRKRLELGFERIYISDMALIRAPSYAQKLLHLAQEFPAQLVIIPISDDIIYAETLKLKRALGIEYFFMGRDLTNAYEEEFGFDRLWNNRVLDDVHCIRIGDIPKGTSFIILHEQPAPYRDWRNLDMEGVRRIMHAARFERKRQSDRAMKAMAGLFKKEDPCAS
jgi:hypothetical protein